MDHLTPYVYHISSTQQEIVLKPGAFVGSAAHQDPDPLDGILDGMAGLETGESWDAASAATSTASKITLAQVCYLSYYLMHLNFFQDIFTFFLWREEEELQKTI